MATPEEARPRFQTHASYLSAFAHLAGDGLLFSTWEEKLSHLRGRLEGDGCEPGGASPRDLSVIEKSLRNAWATEVLIHLACNAFDDDDMIRVSNGWAVIQLYYTVYHGCQAFAQANGHVRPTSHPKTVSIYRDLWCSRSWSLPPWTIKVDATGVQGFQDDVDLDDSIHAWSRVDSTTAPSIAAKSIRTTRDEHVQETQARRRDELRKKRREKWRREEEARLASGKTPRKGPPDSRPRLVAEEKAQIQTRTRAFTMADYLYRLRVNANYDDSAIFIDGPDSVSEALQVQSDVQELAVMTLGVHEWMVASKIGPKTLRTWAVDWERRSKPADVSLGPSARLQALLT